MSLMENKLDVDRDNLIENDPQGISILSKDQKTEISLSRKDARASEVLSTVLLSSDAKEDRKGWTENQYKNEPLLRITVPTDFDISDIEIIVNYLRTGKLPNSKTQSSFDIKTTSSNEVNENLFKILKLADWFGIPQLIREIAERVKKNYVGISSQKQLLPSFESKLQLIKYYPKEREEKLMYFTSVEDVKTRTDAFTTYLNTKLPEDVREYILYETGEFIATNMHFGSYRLLKEFGRFFPNVISRYNSGKIVVDVEGSANVASQMRELEICPYKFIYGILKYKSSSSLVFSHDFLKSPFEDVLPSSTIYLQGEQYAVSNFLVDNTLSLASTIITPPLRILAIRKAQYNFQSSSLFNPETNLQRLLKVTLLKYKDFIPNYLPLIANAIQGNEYKCLPIYTCPFFFHQNIDEYVSNSLQSFGRYAMLLDYLNEEDRKSIIIDTKYPYESYTMEISGYPGDIEKIDEYRFYMLGPESTSISVYDTRNLKNREVFKPIYYDDGSDSKNATDRWVTDVFTNNGIPSYYVAGDIEIHSLDDGKFISNIPFETKGEFLADYADTTLGNYFIRNINGGGVEIFSFADFKTRLFPVEKGSKFDIGGLNDYPGYLFILKSMPQEGKLIVDILKGIETIKSYTFYTDHKEPYSYDIENDDGKIIVRRTVHDNENKSWSHNGYEIKDDLSNLFPPAKPKREKLDKKYLDTLATRLINSPVFTMEDVKIILDLRRNYDGKNMVYATGEEKVKAKDIVEINRYPLSNGDIIFNTYIDKSKIKKIADTYKYCKFTDSFSKLNCECGGIIEVLPDTKPKEVIRPRLVVTYGYSGYPEIWI